MYVTLKERVANFLMGGFHSKSWLTHSNELTRMLFAQNFNL